MNTHKRTGKVGAGLDISGRPSVVVRTQKKELILEHELRGKRSGNVWFQLGKEVGFRMTNHSDIKIGRIAGHCKGWIAVDVWIPQGTATKSTRHKNGLPSWKKPEAAERITIQDTQAFPLSTTLLVTQRYA